MNKAFWNVVHPVISHALDLKARLDRGDEPDFESEQRKLTDLLNGEGGARRLTDYAGDGTIFLGAHYALTCWIDDLFVIHDSPWSSRWAENILELALFGTRDAAWKFWDQLDLVLKRPNDRNSKAPPIPPSSDARETFFLCVSLGFRGKYLNDPAKIKEYFEEMRAQVVRSAEWEAPRDLGVTTNVEPLTGRQTLRRVLAVYGAAALASLLALAFVVRIYLNF
jgi:type VI secretion system protein ImpK